MQENIWKKYLSITKENDISFKIITSENSESLLIIQKSTNPIVDFLTIRMKRNEDKFTEEII